MAPEERTAERAAATCAGQMQARENELLRVLRELPPAEAEALGAPLAGEPSPRRHPRGAARGGDARRVLPRRRPAARVRGDAGAAWRSCPWRACPPCSDCSACSASSSPGRAADRRTSRPARASVAGGDRTPISRSSTRSWWRRCERGCGRRPPGLRPPRRPALRAVPRLHDGRAVPGRLLFHLLRAQRDRLRPVPAPRRRARGRWCSASPRRTRRSSPTRCARWRPACPPPSSISAPTPRRPCSASTGDGKRFVHIAAHGFFRPDNPMFSGDPSGRRLLPHPLRPLQPGAARRARRPQRLRSGVSVIAAGDELLGLARGLFRAGAASLLLTLWEVPDQSTARFHEGVLRPSRGAPPRRRGEGGDPRRPRALPASGALGAVRPDGKDLSRCRTAVRASVPRPWPMGHSTPHVRAIPLAARLTDL